MTVEKLCWFNVKVWLKQTKFFLLYYHKKFSKKIEFDEQNLGFQLSFSIIRFLQCFNMITLITLQKDSNKVFLAPKWVIEVLNFFAFSNNWNARLIDFREFILFEWSKKYSQTNTSEGSRSKGKAGKFFFFEFHQNVTAQWEVHQNCFPSEKWESVSSSQKP